MAAQRDAGMLKVGNPNGFEESPLADKPITLTEAGIDKNLADRAKHTARRKAIYLELHPETKNGGDRRGPDRQVGELKEADRFTADTACT